MSIPSKGGIQQMLCIPLRKLNGWLFSINPAKFPLVSLWPAQSAP
ncbi:phage antirepressor N-terminal domain-containing protein [Shewanella algae]|nr:hypothetical protein [Shewanella algae]